MTSDLLQTSAETWSDHAHDRPAVDPRLTPPAEATPVERFAAWRMRHHLRRSEAERVYADSRNPERGWPVADNRAVLRFFRTLIAERRRMFVALVVLNALAAGSGLVVPRLLGVLVDRTVDQAGAGLDALALLVVARGLRTGRCSRSSPSGPRRCSARTSSPPPASTSSAPSSGSRWDRSRAPAPATWSRG